MKVCLLTLEWPDFGGGIGTYMYNLAKGLHLLGHNVTVITHNNQPRKIEGVNIIQVPIHNHNNLRKKVLRWRWEPHHSWSYDAWECFKNMNPAFDIIETAEYGAWARYFIDHLNTPLVVRCHTPAHGIQEISNNDNGRTPIWLKLEDKLEQFQTKNADAISAPSHALSNHICMSWGISTDKIKILPNPVDTDVFKPNGSTTKRKEILYVGRLQYNKGIYDLTEAVKPLLAEYPDLTLRIIGKDLPTPKCIRSQYKMASEEILSRIAPQNRKQVIISGWVEPNEVIQHQQNAMCTVVPSRGFESFSYTLTEQMACGAAVVATHCGGPTEIVNNEIDGLLVSVGDIQEMTTALQRLIANPQFCRELGRCARKKVEEKYAIRKVVSKFADWYRQIMERY